MTATYKAEPLMWKAFSLQRIRGNTERDGCHHFNGNKHCFGPLCKQYTAAISSDGSSTLSQQFLKRGTV